MNRFVLSLCALLIITLCSSAAAPKLKVVDKKVPKEVKKDIAGLFSDKAIELRDAKDKLLAEIWFRKSLEVKASEDDIKKGLSYQSVKQTTMLGLIQYHAQLGDYRGQKPKKGLYTMRLGFQPMDGDHMGTAPFASFVLLSPVANDSGKKTVDYEGLQELSTKASGTGHPCIWLLFPVESKEMEKAPQILSKFGNHTVLIGTTEVTVDGKKKGVMGIGLTIVGISDAA